MSSRMYIAAAILAAASQASFAMEKKTIGEIKGTFGGEAATWSTIEMTDGKQTDASARLNGSGLLLQGYKQAGGTLTVEISGVDAVKPGVAHSEIEISYFPAGTKGQFWTSEGVEKQRPTIRFSTLTQTGKKGRAEGEFAGQVCSVANSRADVDLTNCKNIQATFATDVLIED